ncbi:hypothetical protein [Allorhizocola rhizosphaerae]|uniref:hypothetical protein n=1 Tax=Allorhizocola rhizosphaerae TaxID=1872709 RepID=UPI0013C2D7D9|nr:hypothetical protein [Allorhizocola rhizosphaerae]
MLALVGVTVSATPAMASATGCALYGGNYGGYFIPGGQYCFSINGSGLTVNFTSGSFNGPVLYNWAESVRFYDTSNTNYATFNKPVTSGAAYGYHYWQLPIHGTARTGRVCGELKSSGSVVATVCHNIFS